MSVSTEEVTITCGNCGGPADGWVEVRIRSDKGIHLDVSLCDECKTAINNALADRRFTAEVPNEPPKTETENKYSALDETVKPQQSSRSKRRGGNAQSIVQEPAADAAPVEEVVPEEYPPVDAESGSDDKNATDAE